MSGNHHEPAGPDYLLANETARVVRGDPDFVKWAICHSPAGLRQRYTAGVINDLTEMDRSHDKKLLDELQAMFLAGRPESSMVWCVIEHTDKGKREFHFVVVNFDLLFGKHVHPYIDRIDRHGFAAWVEYFALRHGLKTPLDKLRRKPPFKHLRMASTEIRFLREVWVKVHLLVRKKVIKSRKDLESQLALAGYQVRCQSYDGTPLEQPEIIGPQGVKLRLKNSVYYRRDFGNPTVPPLVRTDPEAVKKRLAELRSIIRERLDFRAHHLIGRLFGVREQRLTPKGRARLRFKELIAKKLACEIEADGPWCKVDFTTVWLAAELLKCGVPCENPRAKKKAASEIVEVHPTDAKKAMPMIAVASNAIPETADAKALEQPSEKGPPELASSSGGCTSKQRRFNPQIEIPPL